jgi:hypothetical protein
MSLGGSALLGLSNDEMDPEEQLERLVRIKKRQLKVLEVQTENTTTTLSPRVRREKEKLEQEITSLERKLNDD